MEYIDCRDYSEYIETLKMTFIDKKVIYNDKIYTIVDVDYNGMIHIDLPSEHNNTTAVFTPGTAMEAIVCCDRCVHCNGTGWCGPAGDSIGFNTVACELFEERK